MKVVLHIGAHLTGTSTFQDYMHRHVAPLQEAGVRYWGPQQTRGGLFRGLFPEPLNALVRDARRRAEGRVKLRLRAVEASGAQTLIVSDANMAGPLGDMIDDNRLYGGIAGRMARFARAFEGYPTTVVFSPRSLERYWSSALSHGVACGHTIPDRDKLRAIAQSLRGWREVITDLARALPGVEIRVMPFENFIGRSEVFLARAADVDAPKDMDRAWLNPAPNLAALRRALIARGIAGAVLPFGMDRWNPFTPEENAALRETYADDMMWLVAGADGLATLTEDQARTRAGTTLPAGAQTQGHADEHEERQVARPG
ncbi:hypothetical protein [Roseobacter fucihabitans]|nr:hypothetical protein [Roseobacter litoralis]